MTTMDPQLLLVFGVIGLAAAFVTRAAYRAWAAPGTGCSTGCGKCAAPATEPEDRRVSLRQVGRS
jgi:hypothetical protein